MAKRKFTQELKDFVRENSSKMTAMEMSERINIPADTIRHLFYSENIDYKKGKTGRSDGLTMAEVNYVKENYLKMNSTEMAKEMGVTKSRVYYICSKYRLLRPIKQKEVVREKDPAPTFLLHPHKKKLNKKEEKPQPKNIEDNLKLSRIYQPIKKYKSRF